MSNGARRAKLGAPKIHNRIPNHDNERLIEYSLESGKTSGPLGGIIRFRALMDARTGEISMRVILAATSPEVVITVWRSDRETNPVADQMDGFVTVTFPDPPLPAGERIVGECPMHHCGIGITLTNFLAGVCENCGTPITLENLR